MTLVLADGGDACAGPLKGWYYSSQFTPLIVFFMLFLAVVKNTALPHFVRFHCMQVCPVLMPFTNLLYTHYAVWHLSRPCHSSARASAPNI